jgi:type VI secretion system Hcp family effector
MKSKNWLIAVVVALGAVGVSAQEAVTRALAPTRSSIIVTVDGLNCTTSAGTASFAALSWSFSATQAQTTGSAGTGAGAGKASLTGLNVTKRADSCSPALFGAVVSGKVVKSLTLAQDNAKEDVFTVTLTNVLVSSYQLSGEQSSDIPSEQVSFVFQKICVSDTQSGTKFCWDASANRAF